MPKSRGLQRPIGHGAGRPDVSVQASGEQTLAGRRLFVELEKDAVTAGDAWLRDIGARVLASGDLVTLPMPFLDTACAPRWSAALPAAGTMAGNQLLVMTSARLSARLFAPPRGSPSRCRGWC